MFLGVMFPLSKLKLGIDKKKIVIAVPKLLQLVPIAHARSCNRFVQPFVAAAHDEDAENSGDILSHLLPLEPSCELFD